MLCESYRNVPERVCEELLASDSKGSYTRFFIGDVFPDYRWGGDPKAGCHPPQFRTDSRKNACFVLDFPTPN